MQIAVQQLAFSESELPLALGCSKRSARRIARELGVRIGARRIVARERLLQWLEQQPKAGEQTRRPAKSAALDGTDRANEFRIR